jgi:hypothetical protein
MSNHCYCGHSEIMPYCDGSHATLGQAKPGQRPSPEAAPPADTAENAAPAPSIPADKGKTLSKLFDFLKMRR